jgi:hypothetical protein
MFPVGRLGGKSVDSITRGYALHLAGVLLRCGPFYRNSSHGYNMIKRYLSNESYENLLFFPTYIYIFCE